MFFFQNNVTILSMIRCLTFLFENKPGNIVSRDTIEIFNDIVHDEISRNARKSVHDVVFNSRPLR